MSLYTYLQLQPVDPQEDGSISELDVYGEDDVIDLTSDDGGTDLIDRWSHIQHDMHE